MDKNILLKNAIELVENEIMTLEDTARKEHEFMKDAPSPMQSHSDTTRSQKEALLTGYEKNIAEKRNSLLSLKAFKFDQQEYVTIGSLVEIYENESTEYFFILPGSSGNRITLSNKLVTILSPNSAIAKALINREEGEMVKINVPKGIREMEIISIK